MAGWLTWQKDRLPTPDDETMPQKQVVQLMELEAGRNLLFLSAFVRPRHLGPSTSLSAPEWKLSQALFAFAQLKEVKDIGPSLRKVLNKLRSERVDRVKESLQFMLQCVTRSVVSNVMPDVYDARYFYVQAEERPRLASASAAASQRVGHQRTASHQVGHTIAHIVDRHVAELVREYEQPKLLTEQSWMVSIMDHAGNPIMLGFLVEQAVLSYLSDDGVLRRMLDDVVAIPAQARVLVVQFEDKTESSVVRADDAVVLYIPKSYNYPAVDAVLRVIQRTGPAVPVSGVKKSPRAKSQATAPPIPVQVTVTVIPIQITMRPIDQAKRDKSIAFFYKKNAWTSDMPADATVKYVFTFIGGHPNMLVEDKTSSLGEVPFRELLLRLDEVSDKLANTVRSARAKDEKRVSEGLVGVVARTVVSGDVAGSSAPQNVAGSSAPQYGPDTTGNSTSPVCTNINCTHRLHSKPVDNLR
jgi:hypothetical protein